MKCVVDANVFVAALRPAEKNCDSCREFLRRGLRLETTMICPMLILAEIAGCIARAAQSRREADLSLIQFQKNPCLKLVPIHQSLAESAARMAAQCFLRGADAIYLATAKHYNTNLITLDDEILKRSLPNATAQTPSAWLNHHQT